MSFTGFGTGDVTVSGDVRPATMTVTGGTHAFVPGENGGAITTGAYTQSDGSVTLSVWCSCMSRVSAWASWMVR